MKRILVTYPGPIRNEELNEIKTIANSFGANVDPKVVEDSEFEMVEIEVPFGLDERIVDKLERVNDYLCAFAEPEFDKEANEWLNFYNQ